MSIAEKLTTIAENEQKVYDKGRTDEWSVFWDAFQHNGSRTDYNSTFCGTQWNNTNFKPKYDIIPTYAPSIFQNSAIEGDLRELLNKQGVKLDFSKNTNCSHLFQGWGCKIRKVGILDLTSNISTGTVWGESYVNSFDKIILKDDGSQPLSSTWFWGGYGLVDITIEGKIGQSCHFSQSNNLSYKSLMDENGIINALYDYSDTSTTMTLTLHASVKAKLSEADIATATQKGWTIA